MIASCCARGVARCFGLSSHVAGMASILAVWLAGAAGHAQTNGAWSNLNGDNLWSNAANWSGGMIANGPDATADFSTLDLTADAIIHLDSSRTIGNLIFGDTSPSNNWILDDNASNGANSLTLAVSPGNTPTITVNNQLATISAIIAGIQGLAINGPGTLVLSGANTFSGGLSVQSGTLRIATINDAGTNGPLGNNTSVTLGPQNGTLEYSGGSATSNMPFTLGGRNNSNVGIGSGTIRVDNAATNLTLSGQISAPGALGKDGPGTLTLNGTVTAENYFGINDGALAVTGTINNIGQTGQPGQVYIYGGAGTNGSATVSGTWHVSQEIILQGGALNVVAGGTVTDLNGRIGVGALGTANVSGAMAQWVNSGQLNLGELGGSGTLTIGPGGSVTDTSAVIGLNTNSSGTATVTGPNATWTNNSELYVGNNGNGTLNINSGGVVNNVSGTVGYYPGSVGTVTIDGAGSTWTNAARLYIGGSDLGPPGGQGTVTVQNGGSLLVPNDAFVIGSHYGGPGVLTVTGAGSQAVAGDGLYIGRGNGTLNVQNGATMLVTLGGVPVGDQPGSTGVANVSSGAHWTNASILLIGSYGNGTMNINSGGVVSDVDGRVAYFGGSGGIVAIGDAGSQWNNSGSLAIGGSLFLSESGGTGPGGTGIVTVSPGGAINVGTMLKLWNAGTLTINGGSVTTHSLDHNLGTLNFIDGTLTIDGGEYHQESNSTYPEFIVGQGGSATLNLINGATATDVRGVLGEGSTGTANVSGGSHWINSDILYIGRNGAVPNGVLNITSGGVVSSLHGVIAYGGTGAATVSGDGSQWTMTGGLIVGQSHGTLTIDSKGLVSDVDGWVGIYTGSTGVVSVSGNGSKWLNSGNTYLGGHDVGVSGGTATVNITSGGLMTDANGYVASLPDSTATVTVSGSNSKWINSSQLFVGSPGNGTLNINSVGSVSDGNGYVGDDERPFPTKSGTGTVTIDGNGSAWTHSGYVVIGYTSNGTTTVQNGGLLTTGGNIGIAANPGASGTLTVTGAGSRVNCDVLLAAGYLDNGTMNINSGGVVSDVTGTVGYYPGSNGTVTVSGTGSQWSNSGNLYIAGNDLGAANGNGTLVINSGGSVSSGVVSIVGYSTNSTGTVNISGGGSQWTMVQSLYVGYSGNGTVSVNSGGSMSSFYADIGELAGPTSTVNVSGSGSHWTNSSQLVIGASGNGTLNITAGGSVTNGYAADVGYNPGSTGTVIVSDPGSQWNDSGNLYVGGYGGRDGGTGTLSVKNGGSLNVGSGGVGHVLKLWAGGTLTIDGGNVTTTSLDKTVGTLNLFDGTLTVAYGPYLQAPNSTLTIEGNTGAAMPTFQLANGATTSGIGNLLIAYSASRRGNLSITGGSTVTSFYSQIGASAGAVGNVLVSDTGSTWTNATSLAVGNTGTGTLTIQNGAHMTNGGLFSIANDTPGTGTVMVTGTNSLLTVGTNPGGNLDIDVGFLGSGTMTIQNGATVNVQNNNWVYVGTSAGATGVLTVDGAGSPPGATQLNLTGSVDVGNSGTGTMVIKNGAVVSAGGGYVGFNSNAVGSVTVDGAGSKWTQPSYVIVGSGGAGDVTVRNGGAFVVSNDNIDIAGMSGSRGSLTITGAGSLATSGNVIVVGYFGSGTLNVLAGGQVTSAAGLIGNRTGSVGIANVSGAGSKWTITGTLAMGNDPGPQGSLNINGGTVQAGGFDTSAAGSATINLNGGVLNTPAWTSGGATNLNFNGGTLQPAASSSNFLGALPASHLNVFAGGAVIDIPAGNGITIPQNFLNAPGFAVSSVSITTPDNSTVFTSPPAVSFSGSASGFATLDTNGHVNGVVVTNPGTDPFPGATASITGSSAVLSVQMTPNVVGGLTKTGAGTLTLTGANNFGGPLNLNGGTLALSTGANSFALPVNVNAGTKLFLLSGSLAADVNDQAEFDYLGGTFGGRLIVGSAGAVGFFAPFPPFVAGNGMLNQGTLLIPSSQTVTLNGAGLDNQNSLTVGGTLNLSTAANANNQNRATGVITISSGGTVAGGSLTTNGAITGQGAISSAIAVASGGAIRAPTSGTLLVNGPVQVNSGGQVQSGAGAVALGAGVTINTGGSMTVGLQQQITATGGLTFAGGSASLTVPGTGTTAPSINISQSGVGAILTVSGSNSISVPGVGSTGQVGSTITYDLLNYTGTDLAPVPSGTTLTFTNGGGGTLTAIGAPPTGWSLVDVPGSPNQIELLVRIPGSETWTGANNGNWDTTTPNWAANSPLVAATYVDGSNVTFADKNPLTNGNITHSNVAIVAAQVGPASITFTNTGAAAGGVDYTFSGGPIGGASSGITLNGTGSVTLNNSNTFAGTVTVNAGQLILGNAGALGNSNGVTVASGSALVLNGASGSSMTFGSRAAGSGSIGLSLAGGGLAAAPAGALLSAAGNNTYSGPLTLTGPTTINSASNTAGDGLTLAGPISGSAALTKIGPGPLTLTGNSSGYTGAVTISAGSLVQSGSLGGDVQDNAAFVYNSGSLGGRLFVAAGAAAALNGDFNAANGMQSAASLSILPAAPSRTITLGGAGLLNQNTLTLSDAAAGSSGTLSINGGTNSSSGALYVGAGWTTNIATGATLTNAGTITSQHSTTSQISGGSLINNGAIQGRGTISSSVTNNNTIESLNYNADPFNTLAFTGSLQNAATGTITADAGTKISASNGLSTNSGTISVFGTFDNGAHPFTNNGTISLPFGTFINGGATTNNGVISLAGGTFSNSGQPMTNNGTISGFGTLNNNNAVIDNNGTMVFVSGFTTINAQIKNENGHTVKIVDSSIFNRQVTNNGGVFNTVSNSGTFAGGLANNAVGNGLQKEGSGLLTVEPTAGNTVSLADNSKIAVQGGTMIFNVSAGGGGSAASGARGGPGQSFSGSGSGSGDVSVGSGVTATVNAGATLMLVGSESNLSSGNNTVDVVNDGDLVIGGMVDGVYKPGTNQAAGAIGSSTPGDPTGSLTINKDSNGTFDHIIQQVLSIGPGGVVTIRATDENGNPLGKAPSQSTLPIAGSLAPADSFGSTVLHVPDVAAVSDFAGIDAARDAAALPGASLAVPEPTTIILLAIAAATAALTMMDRRMRVERRSDRR